MGFWTAKRLNAQFTFYQHADLPLSYTTNLLDPIEPLSLKGGPSDLGTKILHKY